MQFRVSTSRTCSTDLQSYTSGDTGPADQQAHRWSSTYSPIPRSLRLSTRPTRVHITQRTMLLSPLNLPPMIRQPPNASPPPQKPFRDFLHRTCHPQERPSISCVSQILPQRLPENTSVVRASEGGKVDVYHLVQQRVEQRSGLRSTDMTFVEHYRVRVSALALVAVRPIQGEASAGRPGLLQSMYTVGSLRQKKRSLKIL